MNYIIGFAINILLCFVIANYWRSKGHDYWSGWILSFLLSWIIGGIVGLFLTDLKPISESQAQASGGQQSVADEIGKMSTLRDKGVLTEEEFQIQKKQLLTPRPSSEGRTKPFFSDPDTLDKKHHPIADQGLSGVDLNPAHWSDGSVADPKCLGCDNLAICTLLDSNNPNCLKRWAGGTS